MANHGDGTHYETCCRYRGQRTTKVHPMTRESILTSILDGRRCISCRPLQKRQIQSLMRLAALRLGPLQPPHHARHSVEASHCSTIGPQGRNALLFIPGGGGSCCIAYTRCSTAAGMGPHQVPENRLLRSN
jgi:hypothetical protein